MNIAVFLRTDIYCKSDDTSTYLLSLTVKGSFSMPRDFHQALLSWKISRGHTLAKRLFLDILNDYSPHSRVIPAVSNVLTADKKQ